MKVLAKLLARASAVPADRKPVTGRPFFYAGGKVLVQAYALAVKHGDASAPKLARELNFRDRKNESRKNLRSAKVRGRKVAAVAKAA